MIEYFDMGPIDWYTVDTLEKLCYDKEVAPQSFKLIYSLAIRENIIKNKATTAFLDLFQVVLAETVLTLEERFEILIEIENENGLSTALIGAYERALKSYGFIGHLKSGNTDYASKQYNPVDEEDSKERIEKYYIAALEKLKDIYLSGDKEFSPLARKSLIFRMQEQITEGATEKMLGAIEEIVAKEENLTDDIRQNLVQLSSEKYKLTAAVTTRIIEFLDKYKPKGINEELQAYVIRAPWVNIRSEDGEFIDVSKIKAIELATQFVDEAKDWLPEIKALLEGEQRQTFWFAEAIGRSAQNPDEIISSAIEGYKKVNIKDQNSIFFIGFLKGVNSDDFTRRVIDIAKDLKETEIHAIKAVKLIKTLKYEDLLRIKTTLIDNRSYLINLEYIDIDNLSSDEVSDFVSWIKEIDHSFALQILYEVLRKRKENRWHELKGKVNELLWVENILSLRSSINTSLHVEDLIINSLKEEPSSKKIKFLIEKIIEQYEDYQLNNDALLNRLTYLLLQEYWEQAWPIIADHLAFHKSTIPYNLNYCMERFNYNNKLLLEWSLDNIAYPPVALKLMDIYRKEDDVLNWDESAKKLIIENGNDSKVLDNLSSKFINYSISGQSAEELYKSRKALLKELLGSGKKNLEEFTMKMIQRLDNYIAEEKKQRENFEIDRE